MRILTPEAADGTFEFSVVHAGPAHRRQYDLFFPDFPSALGEAADSPHRKEASQI